MYSREARAPVESMNAKAVQPLVMKQANGKGGDGTYLTEESKKAIEMFKQLEI